jgi:hypothetical protein
MVTRERHLGRVCQSDPTWRGRADPEFPEGLSVLGVVWIIAGSKGILPSFPRSPRSSDMVASTLYLGEGDIKNRAFPHTHTGV